MAAACSIDGCDSPVEARGWCRRHYQSWYRGNGAIKEKPSGRTCRWCGTDISHRQRNARICSRRCAEKHDPRRKERNNRRRNAGYKVLGTARCAWCNNEFEVLAKRTTYCDRSCAGKARSEGKSTPVPWEACADCGDSFVQRRGRTRCNDCRTVPSNVSRVCWHCQRRIVQRSSRAKFCDDRCRGAYHRMKDRTPLKRGTCRTCGGYFLTRCPTQTYCSPDCRPKDSTRGIARSTRLAVYERDGYRCHLCGGMTNRRPGSRAQNAPSLDHLIPRSADGTNDAANLATAHIRCNWQRSDQGPAQLRLAA